MKYSKKEQPYLWKADYSKVQHVLNGNQAAWDELYPEAYALARKMAWKSNQFSILKDEDIQDIVSEAFHRCLTRMHSFQGLSRFSTWVCGFVRYVSLETIRKKCGHQRKLQNYLLRMPAVSQFSDPESNLIKKERDTCLWVAFYSLSARHRALIACFVLHWNSMPEVSAMTGLCYAKMKSELPAAVRILRSRFLTVYYV